MSSDLPRKYRMIDTLTGLRAYAAMWALSRHFFLGPDYAIGFAGRVDLGPVLLPFAVMGSYAIDIFFVLSGFVLTYVYRELFIDGLHVGAMWRYYAVRLGRIYPVHVALLGVMAVGYALGMLPWDNRPFDWPGLIVNLALVQSWGFYDALVWNRPSWTISAEWFAYLLFPLFVVTLGRIRRVRSLLAALVVLTVVYYVVRFEVGDFVRGNLGPGSLLRAAFGFLIGFFLYGLWKQRFLERAPWDALCVASIAALLGLSVAGFHGYHYALAFHAPISLLVFGLLYANGYAARIFDNRVAVYLGEISYSIYLAHFPLLRFLTYRFGGDVHRLTTDAGQLVLWLCTLAMALLLIAVAAVCYHVVELPCRNYIKRRVAA